MKKIISIIAINLLALVAVSCYDDSELKNTISDYESRLAALETSINSLSSYQVLLSKLNSGKTVTSYSSGSGVYTLTFSDGSSISFDASGRKGDTGDPGANGAPGAAGAPGANGEPGADGNPGLTPTFKIENETWFVSYDNGSSWADVGSAVNRNLISGISASEDQTAVCITLADGTVLTLPMGNSYALTLSQDYLEMERNTTYSVNYTIEGFEDECSVFVDYDGEWDVSVEKTDATHGTISLFSGYPYSGQLTVWASDGKETVKSTLKIRMKDYFYIDNYSYDDGNVSIVKIGSPDPIKLRYSTDGCNSWSEVMTISETISIPLEGYGCMYLDGTENKTFSKDENNYWSITFDKRHYMKGDLITLVWGAESIGKCMFIYLFKDDVDLVGLSLDFPDSTAEKCYMGMCQGCTSLRNTYNLDLPATVLADRCYESMFSGCTSLQEAPVLPASTLAKGCYYQMFMNCSSLYNVECYAKDVSASDCVKDWLKNVSSSGTITCYSSVADVLTGDASGCPDNWTVTMAQ